MHIAGCEHSTRRTTTTAGLMRRLIIGTQLDAGAGREGAMDRAKGVLQVQRPTDRGTRRPDDSAELDPLDGSLNRALQHIEAARPCLVRALRGFGLSLADRDDVLQMAITELALRWKEDLARGSVRQLYAHVLHAARLRARDVRRSEARRLRREQRFGSVPPEAPLDPEGALIHQRERAAYIDLLGRLPPTLVKPLVLSVINGLTCEQISAMLNLPVGTVKTRLRRVRALCPGG